MMTARKKLTRVDKVAIAEEAWRLCYQKEACFTTIALAARLHMPPNRHFRQYLNSLATKGLLQAQRELGDDGHYRKYFYAQNTKSMFAFDEKEKIA